MQNRGAHSPERGTNSKPLRTRGDGEEDRRLGAQSPIQGTSDKAGKCWRGQARLHRGYCCKRTRGATDVSRLLGYEQGMRDVKRVMVGCHCVFCNAMDADRCRYGIGI